MSEQITHLEKREPKLPEAITATPLVKPITNAPAVDGIAGEPEKDREFIWVIIWVIWGVISGTVLDDGSNKSYTVVQVVMGAVVGAAGGILGEKKAGPWARKHVIAYWTIFWAAIWSIVIWIPIGCTWLLARLLGQAVEGMGRTTVMALIFGVGIGTMGGALGGWIRSKMPARHKQTPETPVENPEVDTHD